MARRSLVIAGVVASLAFGAAITWLKAVPRAKRSAGPAVDEVVEDPDDDDGDAPPTKKGKSKLLPKAKGKVGKAKAKAHTPPPVLPPERRPMPAKGAPNVVLVFGCTVRRDQIGAYGGEPGVTPWLDGLAASGTRFDDALSVSSWTRASAVGVVTGRHPLSFNLPEPGPKQSERVLPEAAVTLAERLATAGWMAYGVTANPNLNSNYGMAQGFDGYQDSSEKAFKRARMSGEDVVNRAMELLDARDDAARERPFYLRLMMIDAHHPRTPPADLVRAQTRPGVSATLAEYRASLAQLDHALDQLDRGLRSRGYDPSNTLVVFVADHGEGLDMPAHHGPGHGKKMYPTTVSIPWILRGPGVPEGRVVEGLASGADVKPTVLGLLKLQGEAGLAGQDVSPWVRGDREGLLPRQQTHSASMFHVANVAAIWTREKQCQTWFPGDRDQDVTGCFDRKADPGFASPIPDSDGLVEQLKGWHARQTELGKAYAVDEAEVGDDQEAQLELLGYLEDE
ncbi:MAG: sulfatase [Alphaproteobacteria bacterium]|nr:sulfatase [Alphaproteobacteria bacterium]